MRMNVTSNDRSILLDRRHSIALLQLLVEEKLIDPAAPLDTKLETAQDIIDVRTPSFLFTTQKMRSDVLLLYAMYDQIRLYLPKKMLVGLDFSKVRAKIIPYTEIPVAEGQTWSASNLKAARAKAYFYGHYLYLEQNPKARIPRSLPAFDELFTLDDIRDLEHLGDLVQSNLIFDPLMSSLGVNTATAVRALCSDSGLALQMSRDAARFRENTQREVLMFILHSAIGIRDSLSDTRSLLDIGGENRAEISWSNSAEITSTATLSDATTGTPDERVIVKALLEEIRGFPTPSSIEGADRIRDSRRMRALWRRIISWSDALRGGKIELADEIRKDLKKASQELAGAETSMRRAGWAGYVSLPVGVAEIVFGLPPVASLGLGVLGVGIDAQSRLARWKNRWFIWS
jgi:hypothetical protein